MGDKAMKELEAAAAMVEGGQLTNEEVEYVGAALPGAEDGKQVADTVPGTDQAVETQGERTARRIREIRRERKAAAAAAEAAKATETDDQRREREVREAREAVAAAEKEAAQAAVVEEAVKKAQAEAEAGGRTLTPREIAIVKVRAVLYEPG